MRRGRVQRGDILIVKDGATTGKTVVVRENYPFDESSINEHVFLLRTDKSKVLPEYVGYFLFGPIGQQQILSNFRGAAIGGIGQDFVRNVHIPVAPLAAQERAVKILDEAAELKRLRKCINDRVEMLIPALFHEMFCTGKSFPTKPLIEMVDADRGISYGVVQRGSNFAGGVPLLRISDFGENVVDARNLVMVDPSISNQYRRTILVGGELVVSIRGTIGRVAIVPQEANGWNVAREVAVVPLLPEYCRPFVHAYMLSSVAQAFMTREVRGIAQRGINLEDLRRLPVPQAPQRLQDKFAKRVSEIREFEVAQAASRKSLETLFQALLHRVFQGEI
jgi:type I restriction enzyme S subunit